MEASRIDGKYRLLVQALVRMHRSRRIKWALTVGSVAVVIVLVLLAARHFATTAWPLSTGHPALLFAVGLLLVLAQWLKAYGWGRLFTKEERPKPLALAAANGGAALIGVALPGRFDDAMRIAVVRRYKPCPTGVRVLCLSLVMLGLIDSVALAPLALAAAVSGDAGNAVRAGLTVVAVAGLAAAAIIVALPRVVASRHCSRFRLGRWLTPRTTSLRRASQACVSRARLLGRPRRCSLLALGCARDRLLTPTRARLPLRRRSSGRAPDRSWGRRDAGRGRRCGPDRLGRRGLPGTQFRGLDRDPRCPHRNRSPRLRGCVAEHPGAHDESTRHPFGSEESSASERARDGRAAQSRACAQGSTSQLGGIQVSAASWDSSLRRIAS